MARIIRKRYKRRRRYGARALLLLIAALLLCLILPSTGTERDGQPSPELAAEQTLQVHFIDVGQGDAQLLICEGQTLLLDGGTPENADGLSAYLREHGVRRLDYIAASHAHSDHVGGLSGPIADLEIAQALATLDQPVNPSFEIFLEELQQRRIPLTVIGSGDSLTLGGAEISVLAPAEGGDGGNDYSLVLRVVYGQTVFLFTGDCEYQAEQWLLDSGAPLSADVLKVGHHGSSDASGYRFLREVAPEFAVISCGSGNDYGHPHEQLLSRLRDAEVCLYRTDIHGHIVFVSDGEQISVSCQYD
ncbi:MAG: ComEC/Rec2 family competence protein [Bacillota bacterium]|nr:ComEC/Rec2 family competence protein [Bacillota bacterium]